MESPQTDRAAPFTLGNAPQRFWITVAVATLLAICLVLVLFLRGYRDGLRRGAAHNRQQVAILLQQASDMLDEGNPDHALHAYRQVLAFDAHNAAALSAVSTIQAAPTSLPVPTESPLQDALETEWASSSSRLQEGRWQEAVTGLLRIRGADHAFRADELARSLFDAYVGLAREHAGNDRLEEAVQNFDLALDLFPGDEEVSSERRVTAQYVDVKTVWGASWPETILLLQGLYRSDPGYRDVQYLLQRAHVEQGESFAAVEEWCAAAAEYTSAIAALDWLDLRTRRSQLAALCQESLRIAGEEAKG